MKFWLMMERRVVLIDREKREVEISREVLNNGCFVTSSMWGNGGRGRGEEMWILVSKLSVKLGVK